MKKLLMIVICFLITGCTVKYNINIDEDLKVTENVKIVGSEDLYKSYYKTSKKRVLNDILNNHIDKLKENNYEYNLVKESEPYVTLEKKYNNLKEYIEFSKLFNDYFEKINYQQEGDIIKIETVNFNPNEQDNPSRFYVEDLDIAVTSKYVVVNSNADIVDENTNTYHYLMNEDTTDFKIILEIDTSRKFNPYLKSIVIIMILLILIVGVWISILLNKKKKK